MGTSIRVGTQEGGHDKAQHKDDQQDAKAHHPVCPPVSLCSSSSAQPNQPEWLRDPRLSRCKRMWVSAFAVQRLIAFRDANPDAWLQPKLPLPPIHFTCQIERSSAAKYSCPGTWWSRSAACSTRNVEL